MASLRLSTSTCYTGSYRPAVRVRGYQAHKDLAQCLAYRRHSVEAGSLHRYLWETEFQDINQDQQKFFGTLVTMLVVVNKMDLHGSKNQRIREVQWSIPHLLPHTHSIEWGSPGKRCEKTSLAMKASFPPSHICSFGSRINVYFVNKH